MASAVAPHPHAVLQSHASLLRRVQALATLDAAVESDEEEEAEEDVEEGQRRDGEGEEGKQKDGRANGGEHHRRSSVVGPLSSSSSPPLILRLACSRLYDGVAPLLSFLPLHPQLVALDLRGNGLTDVGLVPLLEGLRGLPGVGSLDLSSVTGFPANSIGEAAAAAFARLLSSPACPLRSLRLSAVGRLSLQALLTRRSPSLTSPCLTALDVSANGLSAALVRRLCRQVGGPQSQLRRLNLNRNDAGDGASKGLQRLLLASPRLQRLSLAHNRLTSASLTALAPALLPDTCGLTHLHLDCNAGLGGGEGDSDGGDGGLSALAAALQVNVGLRALTLSHCGLRDVSGLCAALRDNSALTHLELSGNPFGSEGAVRLLTALQSNSGMLQLHLANCRIDDSILPATSALLLSNPYLQRLSLRGNRLTDAFLVPLLQSLLYHATCNLPFPGSSLSHNHLSGHSLARLKALMQRNHRMQRATLLRHYRERIDRLHSLPEQVLQCRREVEALHSEVERERERERSTALSVQRQRERMEADTALLLQQLEALKEERRLQQRQQSEQLADLSARLAVTRAELKAAAGSVRAEVVAEKKIQAQLQKQLSRAEAVWDGLEEIRRSGDAVFRTLDAATQAALEQRATLRGQCELWATRLTAVATRVVHRYWIALHAYSTSSRRAAADRQPTPTSPSQTPPAAALPPPPVAQSSSQSDLSRFVPVLPPLGSPFDVQLLDFVPWLFHTSTPSAVLALVDSALQKRMPVVAFAQAVVATSVGRVEGEEGLWLPVTNLAAPGGEAGGGGGGGAGATASSSASASLLAHHPSLSSIRRSLLSALGLESVDLSGGGEHRRLAEQRPALFSGCTLIVHAQQPSQDSARRPRMEEGEPPASALPPSALAPLRASPSVTASAQWTWEALLSRAASALDVPVTELTNPPPSSSATSSSTSASPSRCVFYLPGLRLRHPWAEYLQGSPETPRLSLEEAMAELGGGAGGLHSPGGASATSAAATSAPSTSSAFVVSSAAVLSLTEDLSLLLADIAADLISARSRPPSAQSAAVQALASLQPPSSALGGHRRGLTASSASPPSSSRPQTASMARGAVERRSLKPSGSRRSLQAQTPSQEGGEEGRQPRPPSSRVSHSSHRNSSLLTPEVGGAEGEAPSNAEGGVEASASSSPLPPSSRVPPHSRLEGRSRGRHRTASTTARPPSAAPAHRLLRGKAKRTDSGDEAERGSPSPLPHSRQRRTQSVITVAVTNGGRSSAAQPTPADGGWAVDRSGATARPSTATGAASAFAPAQGGGAVTAEAEAAVGDGGRSWAEEAEEAAAFNGHVTSDGFLLRIRELSRPLVGPVPSSASEAADEEAEAEAASPFVEATRALLLPSSIPPALGAASALCLQPQPRPLLPFASSSPSPVSLQRSADPAELSRRLLSAPPAPLPLPLHFDFEWDHNSREAGGAGQRPPSSPPPQPLLSFASTPWMASASSGAGFVPLPLTALAALRSWPRLCVPGEEAMHSRLSTATFAS